MCAASDHTAKATVTYTYIHACVELPYTNQSNIN